MFVMYILNVAKYLEIFLNLIASVNCTLACEFCAYDFDFQIFSVTDTGLLHIAKSKQLNK